MNLTTGPYTSILTDLITPLHEVIGPAGERFCGVPRAADHASWLAADPVTRKVFVAAARADLARPWPTPLVSEYAQYWRDGDRQPTRSPTRRCE